VQDDAFPKTASITICAFTTADVDASLLRPAVLPSEENGLRSPSHVMIDKVTTLPRGKLGERTAS
jgi:mRNA interferase MazF